MPRKDGLNQFGQPIPSTQRTDMESADGGPRFWRTLEELGDAPEFREALQREFPHAASQWPDPTSRREFLKLMGASLALAGLNGCGRQPEEKIVPYVESPEEVVPGKPLFYATAVPLNGLGTGVLVESHMGRPTKVEGNPDHPASLGATDPFAQASVLDLYDPDRSEVVTRGEAISTWSDFLDALTREISVQQGRAGAGLRILTETVTSPTLADQLHLLLERFPKARWHQYEPVNRDNARRGAKLAFGSDVNTVYHLDRADVVLSLDADILATGPGRVRYARDFSTRRRNAQGGQLAPRVDDPLAERADHTKNSDVGHSVKPPEMNRLYVVESTRTLTGAMADHRLPLRPSQMEAVARAVAFKLGVKVEPPTDSELGDVSPDWLKAVVDDLQQPSGGSSLVIAGESQPPTVHALVHAVNDALGSMGKTVTYTDPVEAKPVDQGASLQQLADDMRAGRVETLIILGGNPVFTAPADVEFAEALQHVPFRVHLNQYEDETSAHCHWHVPQTHFLESWSDIRAYDGTVTIMQPLIAPLYNGKSAHELLSVMLGQPNRTAHQAVQKYWRRRHAQGGQLAPRVDDPLAERADHTKQFDDFWQTALHDGIVPETRLPTTQVSLREEELKHTRPVTSSPPAPGSRSFEIVFRPDPTIGDGRFANNGWLQELPKPFTTLTWDNAALIGPATAETELLANGDVVEITFNGRTLRMPVWVLPGHPDGTITVHFGDGRTRAGRVGTGAGFNVYPLRTNETMWFGSGATLHKTNQGYALATTQHHHLMDGRDLIRTGTVEQYRQNPEHPGFVAAGHEAPPSSFYPEQPYDGYQWGMSIDVGACTGCNACVVACQAENNIPVVGKSQVAVGREMHWLRIDSYYEGKPDDDFRTYHQPVPCMHCEKAPCEPVCPVAATTHSEEGLNEMTYNRCVGTRYCSNNCPYKVRRFNYLDYRQETKAEPVLHLLQNPDVTVRSRGVMEKCTYCVQRINAARIKAEKEDRRIRDGEVVTACQAACPTQAIVFGDMNDPQSLLRTRKDHPLDYALLAELNTRPRTTYLAAVRNPNPAIET